MCGIAGVISSAGVNPDLVRDMCQAIRHRGPDGEGYHVEPTAVMGMRRLAIIDVAGGQQPVSNEDGTVVAVFNGEIYNFPELRRDLLDRGHLLKSEGDSECLVHLYEEYGDDLVHRLRGMFAFAIWDRARQRLLLARDRVGKKPLYWCRDHQSIRFASELKSLLRDQSVPREVDLVALHHYLTYQYVPAPWSIIQNVQKLPPGHLLVWERGVESVRQYWQLNASPRTVLNEHDEEERLRELLLEATRIRMMSERPLGAFLSGGIDSSAVVAAMAMQTSERVRTFSIGFEDARFDERSHARLVAQRYDTDHHELVVTPALLDVLPQIAWCFDEPFADSSAIPSYYVAQLSRQHVTVALNGDGGDECFGGYLRYVLAARLSKIPVCPSFLAPGLSRLGTMLIRRDSRTLLRRAGRALQYASQPQSRRHALMMSYFTPEQKTWVYTDALRARLGEIDSYSLLDDAYLASNADTGLGRILQADISTYLPGDLLVKVDITTMAHSLEARSPLLDHKLMEWAAGLPIGLKIRGKETKRIFRQAVAPWLPDTLVTRPKQGFGVPLAAWLRGELRELAFDTLTDHSARSRGYFRPEAVLHLLQNHQRGADHSRQIWALLQLELWHRAHVTTAPGCPVP
ncbi:asparagine synthase (glutamine-hydrolysing) [Nonomuraea polychroma]|uniref:asparagine synthase (glutamine-hydrolyzing) n=1 Tax=Nonomuraea polychroma TaxID=46176 RepID=A0A438MFM4_9ACTN|nr:asparagine synthase (glutamine-hydrolyzing) [Nonomuraea polychroma]RVX44554.1 asparagine synthase (glutamine-hydrolysing) [Nonomuraea polychroma]